MLSWNLVASAACPANSQCRLLNVDIDFMSHLSIGNVAPDNYCNRSECSGAECDLRLEVEGSGGTIQLPLKADDYRRKFVVGRFGNNNTYTVKPKLQMHELGACLPDWSMNAGRLEIFSLKKPEQCATTQNEFIKVTCNSTDAVAEGIPVEENSACGKEKAKSRQKYNFMFRELTARLASSINQQGTASIKEQAPQIKEQATAQGYGNLSGALNTLMPLIASSQYFSQGIAVSLVLNYLQPMRLAAEKSCSTDCVNCSR